MNGVLEARSSEIIGIIRHAHGSFTEILSSRPHLFSQGSESPNSWMKISAGALISEWRINECLWGEAAKWRDTKGSSLPRGNNINWGTKYLFHHYYSSGSSLIQVSCFFFCRERIYPLSNFTCTIYPYASTRKLQETAKARMGNPVGLEGVA